MHIDKIIELLHAAKSAGESPTESMQKRAKTPKAKAPRKASAYSKKYAKAFKSIAPKHKKKSGGWKKDGYKRAVKAAHKKAKGMR